VEIHPETAKGFSIKNGNWVYIETPTGRIKQRAVLTEGLDPRVIGVDYGWWFPEKEDATLYDCFEANLNRLTSDQPPYNQEIGSTNLRGLPCRIYPAEENDSGVG
jgi:anaerobic selenocysteine-containing dehydrogenase